MLMELSGRYWHLTCKANYGVVAQRFKDVTNIYLQMTLVQNVLIVYYFEDKVIRILENN